MLDLNRDNFPNETEEFVLKHRLEFCILPINIKRELFFFLNLSYSLLNWLNINLHPLTPLRALKGHLAYLDHVYRWSNIDKSDIYVPRKHFNVVKSLTNNDFIVISKPDKRSGVFLLNGCDYINKMAHILNYTSTA